MSLALYIPCVVHIMSLTSFRLIRTITHTSLTDTCILYDAYKCNMTYLNHCITTKKERDVTRVDAKWCSSRLLVCSHHILLMIWAIPIALVSFLIVFGISRTRHECFKLAVRVIMSCSPFLSTPFSLFMECSSGLNA